MSDTKLRENRKFVAEAAEECRAFLRSNCKADPPRLSIALLAALGESIAVAEAPSEAQPARAHRFGQLLCRLLECDALGDAADNMPEALLDEWQTATEEHIDSTAGKHAQPAPKAPETLPSDATLDQLRELGAWAYQRDLEDGVFRERARLILKAAQADQPKEPT